MGKTPKESGATVEAEKTIESKAVVLAEKAAPARKGSGGSVDRDIVLAGLQKEKNESYIKAWEESEKAKADNKAQKKLAVIDSWENSKKASLEAKLNKTEEEKEKKNANYREKTKNKIAMVHKRAQEKRATVEAHRGEEKLKAEETAAKYRATGRLPKKFFNCF